MVETYLGDPQESGVYFCGYHCVRVCGNVLHHLYSTKYDGIPHSRPYLGDRDGSAIVHLTSVFYEPRHIRCLRGRGESYDTGIQRKVFDKEQASISKLDVRRVERYKIMDF